MTNYVISGNVESHKLWWHGEGWTHIRSEAQPFASRQLANEYRALNLQRLSVTTVDFLKVEHGTDGHATGTPD